MSNKLNALGMGGSGDSLTRPISVIYMYHPNEVVVWAWYGAGMGYALSKYFLGWGLYKKNNDQSSFLCQTLLKEGPNNFICRSQAGHIYPPKTYFSTHPTAQEVLYYSHY